MIEDREDGPYEVTFKDLDTRCTYEAYVAGAYKGQYGDIFKQTSVGERKIELSLKDAHKVEREEDQEEDLGTAQKARIYVTNAGDVPPGYMVQRGKKGGIYYESDRRTRGGRVNARFGVEDKDVLNQLKKEGGQHKSEWDALLKSLEDIDFPTERLKFITSAEANKFKIDEMFQSRSGKDMTKEVFHQVLLDKEFNFYINARDPPDAGTIKKCMWAFMAKKDQYVEGRLLMPKVIFMGATDIPTFTYDTRDQVKRESTVAADCHTMDEPVIRVYDNLSDCFQDIMTHELGHALHAQLAGGYNLEYTFKLHDVQYLQHVTNIKLYNIIAQELYDLHGQSGMMATYLDQYLKEPRDLIEAIREKKGREYWDTSIPKEGLDLFGEGYNCMEAMMERFHEMKSRKADAQDLRLSEEEQKAWGYAREEYEATNPSLWEDWKTIYKEEDWEENEYADRNPQEMFAEFYDHTINAAKDMQTDIDRIEFNLQLLKEEYLDKYPEEERNRPDSMARATFLDLRTDLYHALELGLRHTLKKDNFLTLHKKKSDLMEQVIPNTSKHLKSSIRKIKTLFNKVYKDKDLAGEEERKYWQDILAEYKDDLEQSLAKRQKRAAARAQRIAAQGD